MRRGFFKALISLSLLLNLCGPSAFGQPLKSIDQQARGSLPVEKDLGRHVIFMKRKERLLATGGTDLVFIGDSITDIWRTDPQREIFEDNFGKYRPFNIGIGGDETQHVLWRIQNGELEGLSPKLVVMMIGTNNLTNRMNPTDTAQGVETLVNEILVRLPNTKILLLGIFPRDNRADGTLRKLVTETNSLIAKRDDGKRVHFLDISQKFLERDGSISGTVMPDYVHLSFNGYERWAEAIKPTVDSLIATGKRR
ncbi:MAG: hypothetical protein IBJ13_06480 [Sphingopyxis sp.]|nr:hypothetical protein [Sphingopyxis sp.]